MKYSLLIILLPFLVFGGCKELKLKTESGFAGVNGTKLYYEVAGKGEPIIFVHGNFGDRRHWDKQFEPLSKKFKVVRYDLRGFGKSEVPKPNEPYSDWDDMKALMDYLKIEKAHICGLSGGSTVAVDFALVYPEKCLSLIPIGPWVSGYGTENYRSRWADSLFVVFPKANEILKSKGPKGITEYLWTGNHSLAKSVRNTNTLNSLLKIGYDCSFWFHLNDSPEENLNPPAISRLSEIKLPTLIVTADWDIESCKEIAGKMEKEIAGSKKISIKDAGHIMNMDQPEVFNSELIKFIEGMK